MSFSSADSTLRPRDSRPPQPGGIGLALCGGGVTGAMYEIGCLAALEDGLGGFDANAFDVYVGTSAGSSVATALAGGVPVKRLYRALLDPGDDFLPLERHHVLRFNAAEWRRAAAAAGLIARRIGAQLVSRPRKLDWWMELERFWDALPAGVFTLDGYEQFVADFCRRRGVPERFGDFRRQLFIPANDLDSGHRTVFGQGTFTEVPVPRAICASSALPIVFEPVRINGRDYVDGGIGKVAHVDILVRWGASLLVVVNPMVPVSHVLDRKDLPAGYGKVGRVRDRGMFGVYNQAFRMAVKARLHQGLRRFAASNPEVSVILLEPAESEATMFMYSPMNFAARKTILKYGYDSTLEYLRAHGERLKEPLKRRGLEIAA